MLTFLARPQLAAGQAVEAAMYLKKRQKDHVRALANCKTFSGIDCVSHTFQFSCASVREAQKGIRIDPHSGTAGGHQTSLFDLPRWLLMHFA